MEELRDWVYPVDRDFSNRPEQPVVYFIANLSLTAQRYDRENDQIELTYLKYIDWSALVREALHNTLNVCIHLSV